MSSHTRWETLRSRLPRREYSVEETVNFAMGASLMYAAGMDEEVTDDFVADCSKLLFASLEVNGYMIVKKDAGDG